MIYNLHLPVTLWTINSPVPWNPHFSTMVPILVVNISV